MSGDNEVPSEIRKGRRKRSAEMRISAHRGKSGLCAHRRKKQAYVAISSYYTDSHLSHPQRRVTFRDLGAIYNQFNKERKINAYLKKLSSLDGKPQKLPHKASSYEKSNKVCIGESTFSYPEINIQ